ncbi:FAD-dependent oxidoreductase [Parasphingorhabdus sp.]|uniref:oxidoreductase n=1 Tax=Parasphingorhabdus sp. TaxID=2709688 RepID=UPI003593B97C
MAQYDALLSSGQIGPMHLKNRILLTSMGAGLAEPDGICGDRIRAFHETQARGGTALVTMGVVGVALPLSQNMINQPAISDDRYIPGLKAVADAVHSHGAKFAIQAHFAGLVAAIDMVAGKPVWTPSIPEYTEGDMLDGFLLEEQEISPTFSMPEPVYRVMSIEDINWLIGMFGKAADRAQRAGVDGIEIHAGHGYLLSSFISPATNKRNDAYGGLVENRSRLLCEIIRAMREAAGPEIAIWCKIDGAEYEREGGITIKDAKITAQLAEDAGAHAITVTAYHDPSQGTLHSGSHTPDVPGLNIEKGMEIKNAVNIPVIVSGRIEPEIANNLIKDKSADFVAMGRKLLADPDLPNKLASNRSSDILPCIYCYTCISSIYYGGSVRCAVNPETAFEQTNWLPPVTKAKHIVVVGGGPGGMESARRLSARGHRVTLVEQSDRLGGTLQFAAIAYEPNERILNWLKRNVELANVEIRLNTPATLSLIEELKPDTVIVASGARRDIPPIPGGDLPNVFSGDDLKKLLLGETSDELDRKTGFMTRVMSKAGSITGANKNPALIREATKKWMPLDDNIVIIGGELVGLELAEFLVERGRKVFVMDSAPKMGAGLQIVRRWRVLDTLREHGVAMLTSLQNIEIKRDCVIAQKSDGRPVKIYADQIIVAKGASGDLRFANELRAAGHVVHEIGDCTGIHYIEGAMRSAAEVSKII